MDRKASTRMVPFGMGIGLLGLFAFHSSLQQEHRSLVAYYAGIATAIVLTAVIGIAAYRRSRRGYSQDDLNNISRNARAARLYPLIILVGVGALAAIRHASILNDASPYILGFTAAFFVSFGALSILDTYWLHAIFFWNMPDKRVRDAWLDK